jgi:hypothetical protein
MRALSPQASTLEQRFDQHWPDIVNIVPGLSKVTPDGKRPSGSAGRAACLKEWKKIIFEEYVKKIAGHEPDLEPKGAVTKKLERVAARALHLMMVIDELAPAMRHQLGIDALRDELKRLVSESRRLTPPRVERSGGSQRRRSDRAIKRMAAEMSFAMLFEWVSVMGTLTPTGPWIRLTEILVKIATGRELGDVSRACSDYLAALEERDVFSREDRREAARERRGVT